MIFVQISLLTLAGLFTTYLCILTLSAHRYKPLIDYKAIEKKKFAVIIPAHNEEAVLSETINHIFSINYPFELFEVIVIADNCTDRTSVIAAKAGALVLERTNYSLKGKGYALKWALEILIRSPKKYDAFFIVDADTMVSENVLQVLNYYINSGAKSIQCSDMVKPQPNSWSAEMTRIGLMLYNYLRPLGKKMLGFSAGLRGNGMCFTSGLITEYPWRAYSQTEDLEYGLNLLLNGVTTIFAPEAVVNAIMPSNPANAETQRARWEMGRLPVVKKYCLRLFSEALKKRSMVLLDSFVDLISPAFVNLFCCTVLMLTVNILFMVLNFDFSITILSIWLALLFFQIFYVLSGLKIAGADRNTYKALYNVPRYAVWKFLLYAKLAFKGHSKLWIRTTRETDTETVLH